VPARDGDDGEGVGDLVGTGLAEGNLVAIGVQGVSTHEVLGTGDGSGEHVAGCGAGSAVGRRSDVVQARLVLLQVIGGLAPPSQYLALLREAQLGPHLRGGGDGRCRCVHLPCHHYGVLPGVKLCELPRKHEHNVTKHHLGWRKHVTKKPHCSFSMIHILFLSNAHILHFIAIMVNKVKFQEIGAFPGTNPEFQTSPSF